MQVRNPNTRLAYGRATVRFFAWLSDLGLSLREVQPVHVAAYIEGLGQPVETVATGAFPISRSRAHTHRRHGHPLQTVPSAGLIERPQEKNRVDALR